MPTDVLFADRDLARLLEGDDAWMGIAAATAIQRAFPLVGAEALRIAGGTATFAGSGSPLTRARGIGMEGPVSSDEIDRLEAFFVERGTDVDLEICPHTDATLRDELNRRGYGIVAFDHVLVRRLGRLDAREALLSAVRVQGVDPRSVEAWSRLVAEGFSNGEPISERAMEAGVALGQDPNATCFWAFLEDRPSGGAALAMREKRAYLFAMSTLVEARRHGVQAALLEARLAYAAEAGCELAWTTAVAGGPSQRNLERFGFRIAYTRVQVRRQRG